MAQTVPIEDRHRIVLTAIIYNDDGKFLVTKRAPTQKAFPNMWTVPGGGVEASDYRDSKPTHGNSWYRVIEKTLEREIKEEVNLEVEKIEYLLDLVFVRPDDVPVLVLSYFAKYKSGDVVLEEGDATEYAWISVEDAKDYDLIDGIYEELVDVDKILKSRS